jgi:hypothetical protein
MGHQREDREKDDRLPARDNDNFVWRRADSARLTDILCNRFAQLRQTRRRSVVREPLVERVGRGPNDVARRIEIGLANLEVDDVAPLCLQRPRFH